MTRGARSRTVSSRAVPRPLWPRHPALCWPAPPPRLCWLWPRHPALSPARCRAHRPCLCRAARPRRPRRRADRGVRPRGGGRRQGRGGPALAAVPAGRTRVRRPAAVRPGVLAGHRARQLPGAAARPARHRPVRPGHPAQPRRQGQRGRSGQVPVPVPGRRDRRRRRADPPRTGRRTVERAWPELRRFLHGDLPVQGTRGAHRGVHHRRPARPGGHRRRRLPDDLPAGPGEDPGALRPLPR